MTPQEALYAALKESNEWWGDQEGRARAMLAWLRDHGCEVVTDLPPVEPIRDRLVTDDVHYSTAGVPESHRREAARRLAVALYLESEPAQGDVDRLATLLDDAGIPSTVMSTTADLARELLRRGVRLEP